MRAKVLKIILRPRQARRVIVTQLNVYKFLSPIKIHEKTNFLSVKESTAQQNICFSIPYGDDRALMQYLNLCFQRVCVDTLHRNQLFPAQCFISFHFHAVAQSIKHAANQLTSYVQTS